MLPRLIPFFVAVLCPFFNEPLFCNAEVPIAKALEVPHPLAFSCLTASSKMAVLACEFHFSLGPLIEVVSFLEGGAPATWPR